ncbi:hypothetical protein HDU84_004821 [Entophlyctis sp. JEL0112]|nr:hypothetical protein HDU84_004821 [Entophlyctis sp. JEL0112]
MARPPTAPSTQRKSVASKRASIAGPVSPFSGKWLGIYCSAKKKLENLEDCAAYNISLSCKPDGSLEGKSLTQEEIQFQGAYNNQLKSLNFKESTRFKFPIVFNGCLVDHNTIRGTWVKESDERISGPLELRRVGHKTSSYEFSSGSYRGCVFDESKSLWTPISFPWLEVVESEIFGQPMPMKTKQNEVHTVRGTLNLNTVSIYVTHWLGQKTSVVAFKAEISTQTGAISGVRLSTNEYGFEDELLDLEDALETDQGIDNDVVNFRMWRMEESNDEDTEEFRNRFSQFEGPVKPGIWKGYFCDDVNYNEEWDGCEWKLQFSSRTEFSGRGDRTSTVDGVCEDFVFDGMMDAGTKKATVYQTFLASLTVYVYVLAVDGRTQLSGAGGAHDSARTRAFVLRVSEAVDSQPEASFMSAGTAASAVARVGVLLMACASAVTAASSNATSSCQDNPQFIEYSSGSVYSLVRDTASWAWIITGVFAAAASILSLALIFSHLRNFNRPLEQVHIVRVLLIVPVYAIISWLAFRFYWRAVYFFIIRDCYEAFVIYSFYALILQFLGPTVQSQKMAFLNKPKMLWPLWHPIMKLVRLDPYFYPASPTFLQSNKAGVIQYVVVRPIMTVVALITQLLSRYCAESMAVMYGHFWYMLFNFVSVSFCMYSLVVLYFTVKDDIAEHRPLPKFLSIKLVIFLTMIQNMVLSILVHFNEIPENQYWTATNISNGIQSFLVCIEMFLISIFHFYSFSAKSYAGVMHTPWFKAMIKSFNFLDIFREMGKAASHLIQRGKKKTAQPERSATIYLNVENNGGANGSSAPLRRHETEEEEEIIEESVVAIADGKTYGTNK